MGSRLRRLIGSHEYDTSGVLKATKYWEALRAAFHQHHGLNQLADICFQLSQQYELELSNHLDRISKGADQ